MDIVHWAGRLPAAGSAESDGTAAAALGPKAGSGIHFPPNPLVRIAATGVWEGVGLGSRSFERILCVGRGDSWPPARPKPMVPLPP